MLLDSTLVTLSIIQPLCLSAGSDHVMGQEVGLLKDHSSGICKFPVPTVCVGQCSLPSPDECELPPLNMIKVFNKEQVTKMC